MGQPNVIIDTETLDNGTWRRIIGQPAAAQQESGTLDTFAVEFVIEADDAATLHTRFQSTEAALTRNGPRFQFTLDEDAGTNLFDWAPGDGTHFEVTSNIAWSDDDFHTARRMHLVLMVAADRTMPTGEGIGGGYLEYDGQESEISVAENYDQSGVLTRVVTGSFVSTFDEEANGPFTTTDIADDGSGFAEFTLTGSLPVFKTGMKLKVPAGTTAYNGVHIVTAISGQDVVTGTAFVGAESTLSAVTHIGEGTTAVENYEVAEPNIFTKYLEVGSSGEKDATSLLALTGKDTSTRSDIGTDMQFILSARRQDYEPTAVESTVNVTRGWELDVASKPISGWFLSQGAVPTELIAQGQVWLDKALTTKSPAAYWADVEDGIRTEIDTQAGETTRVLLSQQTFDPVANTIRFHYTLRTTGSNTLTYQKSTATATAPNFTMWSDANGDDLIQRPARADNKVVTITARRVGEGFVAYNALVGAPPSEGGFKYMEIDRNETVVGPKSTEWSVNTYDQSVAVSFKRTKPKSGGGPQHTAEGAGGTPFREPPQVRYK